jgi:hypothetical protein
VECSAQIRIKPICALCCLEIKFPSLVIGLDRVLVKKSAVVSRYASHLVVFPPGIP